MLVLIALSFGLLSVFGVEVPPQVAKTFSKCSAEGGITGIINCAGVRTLKLIEKLEQQPILEIYSGVALISDSPRRNPKEMKQEVLPQNPEERASMLFNMLINATSRIFTGRTLKIKLPETASQSIGRALEEGRKKMNKMMNPFILGLGTKMLTVFPIMWGAVGLLATKALIVSKLALAISLAIFLPYLLRYSSYIPINNLGYGGGVLGYGGVGYNGYGGVGTTYGTNNLGGVAPQYPYARSFEDADDANKAKYESAEDLAYSGHKL